jgi:outer membrane lipoprotein-sorting protein
MMKRKVLVFLLMLPLLASAQKDGAAALLDKVVATIKSDAALQMDYTYTIYDEDDAVVYKDNGTMKLDNDRYMLDMENMKVWCDGKTQWSYMKDIDEVYITDADSEEAQNLSPLYIMEMYRENCSLVKTALEGDAVLVTMTAADVEAEVNKLELFVDAGTSRLTGMFVYMPGQGCVEVRLENYVPKCKFAKKTYECPVGIFPTAEIVDMR